MEELLSIGPSHFQLVIIAEWKIVKPLRGLGHGLIGIIRGEHDAVGAGLHHGTQQSGGTAVAAGGDVEIIFQIMCEGALGLAVPLVTVHAIADSPDLEGQQLTHMADDNLQLGKLIKETAGHQAQTVRACFHMKAPRRTEHPVMACILLFQNAWNRHSGVQINGNPQLFHFCPEWQIPGIIQINRHIGVINVAVTIYQSPLKAQFPYATLQFLNGGIRILGGQRGKGTKAIRQGLNFFCQIVIDVPGGDNGLPCVTHSLDGRRGEGENRICNPVFVHLLQPLAADVANGGHSLLQLALADEIGLNITQKFFRCKMFFQCDFTVHDQRSYIFSIKTIMLTGGDFGIESSVISYKT